MPGAGIQGSIMPRLARHAGMRVFRLFARPLASMEAGPPAPESIELRVMRAADVLLLCSDTGLDLEQSRVRAAHSRGDVCVGAYCNAGLLVGYCWAAFSTLPHLDGVWVDFGAEAMWTYKSLVRPSHRGRGIAPALYRFADSLGTDRRRRVSIICVESHNRASMAAAARAGYAPDGCAAYVRRGRRLFHWRSPAARRRALRFYVPER